MRSGKHWMLPAWMQFLLATPVQFILGHVSQGWMACAEGADRQYGSAGRHRHHGGLGALDVAVADGGPGEMVHLYFKALRWW